MMMKFSKNEDFYKKEILPNLKCFDEERKSIKEIAPIEDNWAIDPWILGVNGGLIWYISDIHIDHKIANNLKKFTEKNIRKYVEDVVDSLLKDYYGNTLRFGFDAIVFCGDTSASFALNKMFYSIFIEKLRSCNCVIRVFAILGNHEMWNFNLPEKAHAAYKDFFDTIGIILLNNTLFIDSPSTILSDGKRRYKGSEKTFLTIEEDELLDMTTEELQDKCRCASLIIWGGTGFAAYEDKFNADYGLYKGALRDREREYEYSEKAEACYEKISSTIYKSNVAICSHMPLKNWCKEENYLSKYKYISGHTHRNSKIVIDGEKYYYADNQIGYNGEGYKFKSIIINKEHNIFDYYKDGIYEISENDYQQFYFGISKFMTKIDLRGCVKYKIKMLKRNGLFLFLLENTLCNKIYLLEGGKKRLLHNDEKYYFDNMVKFSKAIKEATKGLNGLLNDISDYVKRIGGNGKIHGSIVDIDEYNHISVNIKNGGISYYRAANVSNRIEYPSFAGLLKENAPELYRKYLEYKKEKEPPLPTKQTENGLIAYNTNDTEMYKYSNILLKVQDMIDSNVIRIWNDEIVSKLNYDGDKLMSGKKQLEETNSIKKPK